MMLVMRIEKSEVQCTDKGFLKIGYAAAKILLIIELVVIFSEKVHPAQPGISRSAQIRKIPIPAIKPQCMLIGLHPYPVNTVNTQQEHVV